MTDRPLAAAYLAACQAYDDAEEHSDALWDARDAALTALRDSDEPRTWGLCEEGEWYTTVEAGSVEDALDIARGNVDRGNYPTTDDEGRETSETIYIAVRVRCEMTGEEDSDRVTVDTDEPECTESEHDWQCPIEIVGGIKENPGCWGHGGGVRLVRVCMHCGCGRHTDTWAQDRETGEQGLTSVKYIEGEFAEEVAALREK